MSWGTRCWLIAKVSLWHLEVRIQARLFSWELRINFPWDKQHSRASGAVQCKFVKKYVGTYVYYNAHCTGLFKSVQKPLLMQTALLEWIHTRSWTISDFWSLDLLEAIQGITLSSVWISLFHLLNFCLFCHVFISTLDMFHIES